MLRLNRRLGVLLARASRRPTVVIKNITSSNNNVNSNSNNRNTTITPVIRAIKQTKLIEQTPAGCPTAMYTYICTYMNVYTDATIAYAIVMYMYHYMSLLC